VRRYWIDLTKKEEEGEKIPPKLLREQNESSLKGAVKKEKRGGLVSIAHACKAERIEKKGLILLNREGGD